MTIQRNLSKLGTGSNYFFWFIKQTLKSAGWTVESSGSGTGGIYDASGDVFDLLDNPYNNSSVGNIGISSGNEHFGNSGCWFRIADPAGNRELLFVRSSSSGDSYDSYWWVGLSESAGFVGGSPNTNTPPDATDERSISQSGSKAVPLEIGVDGTTSTVVHVAADDVPNSTTGEYGFIALEIKSVNQLSQICGLDDLLNTAVGDPSPFTIFHHNNLLTASNLYSNSSNMMAVFDNGGAGELFEAARYAPNYLGLVYANKGGASLYDSEERALPYPVLGYNIGGYIGLSRWIKQPGVARDYPNTGGSKTILFINEIVIEDLLDGTTTPSSI